MLTIATDATVLEIQCVSQTSTTPISTFTFVGRSARFEADYLIQA